MNKAPFLTGSHAYGTPHEDSDLDLVVWVENTKLRGLLEHDGYPIRFGCLNLILVDDETQWEAWRKGTDELVFASRIAGPINRSKAVDYLVSLGVSQVTKDAKPYSNG